MTSPSPSTPPVPPRIVAPTKSLLGPKGKAGLIAAAVIGVSALAIKTFWPEADDVKLLHQNEQALKGVLQQLPGGDKMAASADKMTGVFLDAAKKRGPDGAIIIQEVKGPGGLTFEVGMMFGPHEGYQFGDKRDAHTTFFSDRKQIGQETLVCVCVAPKNGQPLHLGALTEHFGYITGALPNGFPVAKAGQVVDVDALKASSDAKVRDDGLRYEAQRSGVFDSVLKVPGMSSNCELALRTLATRQYLTSPEPVRMKFTP